MYKVMLAFNKHSLLREIKELCIWGDPSEFEIEDAVDDGITAYRKMRKKHYDLVITEIELANMDGLQLLRSAKKEGLCSHIVLCSEKPDFEYARQGIILGAFDYFVKPFDESLFFSMFNRIKNEVFESEASGIYYTGELSVFFENRDKGIYSYISTMLDELYKSDDDLIKLDRKVGHICKSVFDEIFGNNEWFDLYVVQQDFYGAENVAEDNKESRKNYYRDALCNLFDEYCELYPYVNNNKIREVILYILNNPENNLKQKNIAAEMYINSSYLSTVFPAQTGMRFVDYLNRVKLKRAAFLLKETNMKIVDIATRLDYKDIGYFSRLFKSKFNVTPSEYRIPDEYDFQI